MVRFTLTVSNAGPDSAPFVQLMDLLGTGYNTGFTYGGDDGPGTYDPVTGIWEVGDMASGTTQTLNITATIITPPTGPYSNTVQVRALGDSPNPSGLSLYLDPDSTANNNVPSEDDQASVTPVVG